MKMKLIFTFLIIFNCEYAIDNQGLIKEVKKIQSKMKYHQKEMNILQNKIDEISKTLNISNDKEVISIDSFIKIESKNRVNVHDQSRLAKTEWIKTGISTMLTVGGSNQSDSELKELQRGGHDPNKNGFSTRGVELSFSGDVDDVFDAQLNLNFHSDNDKGSAELELEEVILHSNSFIKNIDLELGYFKTIFGNKNKKHAHEWTFIDQNIISNRLFGGDGMAGGGFSLSYQLKDRNYSQFQFGVQNASGSNMNSFQNTGGHNHEEDHEEGHDEHEHGDSFILSDETKSDYVSRLDDFLYSFRYEKIVSKNSGQDIKYGFSYLTGPNNHISKKTFIGGFDLAIKKEWLKENGEFSSYLIESEYMKRNYQAVDEGLHGSLEDIGYFIQGIYHPIKSFGYGLRYEKSWSGGDFLEAFSLAQHQDRQRMSALFEWKNSEFSKVRLQYNHDQWDHLSQNKANSIWLAFDVFFGDHPYHKF
ncbi:MAG: hypothetical protein COB02_08240 [Candidatus Cloacimonadota bacterium]|nr:MAG: hypothetical protein COB02_08240 [Candidatus Cloacimonadota bacterium]